jgi:hypothetical protein
VSKELRDLVQALTKLVTLATEALNMALEEERERHKPTDEGNGATVHTPRRPTGRRRV